MTECGGCDSCCVDLDILSEPTWDAVNGAPKPAGVACKRLVERDGGGRCCSIHSEDRLPQTCRRFLCGWMEHGGLGLEYRPDASNVMFFVSYSKMFGMRALHVVETAENALESPKGRALLDLCRKNSMKEGILMVVRRSGESASATMLSGPRGVVATASTNRSLSLLGDG